MLRQNLLRVVSSAEIEDPLALLADPQLRRQVREALTETDSWHQRQRLLSAPFVLSYVLAHSLYRDHSLADLLGLLAGHPGLGGPEGLVPTSEAAIKAKIRLGWEPLQALFEKQGQELRPPPTFRNLRVWALDGVRFTMPDTKANVRTFGKAKGSRGTAAFPQTVGVCLVDVHGRRVREATFGPYNASERDGIANAIRNLDGGDLVIQDRGFASAEVFERYKQAGVHFLARIPNTWKPRYIARLRDGEWLAEVKSRVPIPEAERRPGGRKTRTVRVKVRIVEYRIGRRQRIRLVTDLTSDEATAEELAHLYALRWECEIAFDEQKNHLAVVHYSRPRTTFRSKTPAGVLQEAYGLLVTYNAIRNVMLEAAEIGSVDPRDISFRRTVQLLRAWQPSLPKIGSRRYADARCLLLQQIAGLVNTRPRRGRGYARVVKRKMSNFPLKRTGHRQRQVDWASKLRLMQRRSANAAAA